MHLTRSKNNEEKRILSYPKNNCNPKSMIEMIHPKLQLLTFLYSIYWTECLLSTCFDCTLRDSSDLKGLYWQSNNCHKKTVQCHSGLPYLFYISSLYHLFVFKPWETTVNSASIDRHRKVIREKEKLDEQVSLINNA